jgi:Transglutaminase-like superfamily
MGISALYNLPSLPEMLNSSTVVEAWLLLWTCRIGLWFAPFPRVLKLCRFCASHFRPSRELDCGAAVSSISRALPFTWHASCLTQALAGWMLLTRHGMVGRVKIGVASPAQRGFKAHAWLECGGRVILGDEAESEAEAESYHVIWTLPQE